MSLEIQATQQQAQTTEQTQVQTAQRPDTIPEKFWDADKGTVNTDALLKSYTELESKLGKQQEPAQQATQTETQTADAQTQQAQEAVGNEAFTKYSTEFAEKGQLSDDSYKELASKGIPKEMVDAYIEGQKLRQTYGQDQVLSSVGGREAFQAMSEWAAMNLTDSELKGYNEQVNQSVESAAIALQWLKTKYEGAVGKAPKLVTGRHAPQQSNGFRSKEEAYTAMRDKRYGKDAAYTADVAERLANRTYTL